MTGQQVSDALFLMREGCGRVEEMQWNHAISPLSPSVSPSSPLRYFASEKFSPADIGHHGCPLVF